MKLLEEQKDRMIDDFASVLERLDASGAYKDERGGVFMAGVTEEHVVIIAVNKTSKIVLGAITDSVNKAYPDAKCIARFGKDTQIN